MANIHIHLHRASVKDFDFAKAPFYVLKRDTEFPMTLGWKKTSNMADPKKFYVRGSTVFYQVSPGRFVPYFAKTGTPFAMSESNFQKTTRDAKDSVSSDQLKVGQKVQMTEGQSGKITALKDENVQVEYHDAKDGGMLKRWFPIKSVERVVR